MAANRDPSPEEISAACLEIQATWTAEEKLRRLRVDLRPTFTMADGRRQDMTSATYNRHHEQREQITARAEEQTSGINSH